MYCVNSLSQYCEYACAGDQEQSTVVVAAVDCTHSPLSLCGMCCISLLYNIATCNIQQAAIILLYTLYIVCSLPI